MSLKFEIEVEVKVEAESESKSEVEFEVEAHSRMLCFDVGWWCFQVEVCKRSREWTRALWSRGDVMSSREHICNLSTLTLASFTHESMN